MSHSLYKELSVCITWGYISYSSWIKHHFACPQCKHYPPDPNQQSEFNRCCRNIPEGKACVPDNKPRVLDNSSVLIDNDDTQGCEIYRFAFGADEMACNAEMGLFYKFKVFYKMGQEMLASTFKISFTGD